MKLTGNLNHLLHMLEVVRRIVGKDRKDVYAFCSWLPVKVRPRYQADLLLLWDIVDKLKDVSFSGEGSGIHFGHETVTPTMPTPDTAFLSDLVKKWQEETGLGVGEAVVVNRHMKDGGTRTWIEKKGDIDNVNYKPPKLSTELRAVLASPTAQ